MPITSGGDDRAAGGGTGPIAPPRPSFRRAAQRQGKAALVATVPTDDEFLLPAGAEEHLADYQNASLSLDADREVPIDSPGLRHETVL
jgi:hypothetical protein